MNKTKLYFLSGIFGLLSLSFLTLDDEPENRFEIGKNLDIFTSLYKEVNTHYVDGTQPGELMKKGIDAMLESLDPYTVYYPESEIEDYKLMTTGQYGGIGARIRRINDFVVISEPYKNFPAYKAGLRAGDIILQVDGKDVKGKSTTDLSKILKGNPGTSLTVNIRRPGTENDYKITFKREKVKIKSVPYYGMVADSIGYLKMNSFTSKVSKEVKDAILALRKDPAMKSLVFDLRGNPGGLLHEAINTVNLFTKKGVTVVETRGKIDAWKKTYKTLNAPLDKDLPIVILVNGGSASASEIVSGALQDFDRAVVLGRNTYGKGLVQTTRHLKYNTSLKVTTAKYYIPSGRCIQAIDYANKDANGNPIKIPDSLLTEFKTKNGRVVLDGAGVKPDLEMEKVNYGSVSRALVSGDYIFNFATNYVLENDSIKNPKTFELSDFEFNKFVSFLDSSNYSFETGTDIRLESLKEKAEDEEYLTIIQTEIDSIQQKLSRKKKAELIKYKDQIKKILSSEIVSRYYFQSGRIENKLGSDPYIKRAIEILSNKTEYNGVLLGNK
jgi:carboxyl-terminal processing protease